MPRFHASRGCQAEPVRRMGTVNDQVAPVTGLQILYAEDDVMIQVLVQVLAEDLGHKVTVVSDGAEALVRLAAESFDLLLIDMQMPVMDGLSATRELRRQEASAGTPRLPVIMLTANTMSEDVAAAIAAGVDLHVAKPISGQRLEQAIGQILRSAF